MSYSPFKAAISSYLNFLLKLLKLFFPFPHTNLHGFLPITNHLMSNKLLLTNYLMSSSLLPIYYQPSYLHYTKMRPSSLWVSIDFK
jgi:hypothetical protein